MEDITILGKQEQDRPMRIRLQNKGDKTKMMEALRNLKNTEDRFQRFSITDDLTKTERKEVSGLIKQAKNWMERGGTNSWIYMIRGETGNKWIK